MARAAGMMLIAVAIALVACARTSPTATPTTQTVMPTPTQKASPTASPTETATQEPSLTLTETPTPTPIPVYALSGHIFFDYNGSGLQDAGEPGIQNAPVCIDSLEGTLCSTSGADGSYSIADVLASFHKVYVQSPTHGPATAFRYINRFLGWVDIPAYEIEGFSVPTQRLPYAQLQPIDQPLDIELSDNPILNIALTQRYLTLPFSKSTKYLLWSYIDLDYRIGHIRNYANETIESVRPDIDIDSPDARSGTSDNHQGIDYYLEVGTPLLAMDNGTVIQAPQEHHFVRIKHNISSEVYVTGYAHNLVNLVSEGDYVYRGQIIALSGDWHMGRHGGTNPHVHSSHWRIPYEWAYDPIFYLFVSGLRDTIPYDSPSGSVQVVDDPYRDVVNPNSLSYWTVDNNPQSSF